MPLVSEQLPNLMNGISQQALSMRLFSQCEEQVNGYSSVVEGVNKRLPLKHVTKIMDGVVDSAYIHTINRDTSERYEVCIFNGNIRVFDLAGAEKSVSYPSGTSYISTAEPDADIRTITLADTTFIVNTKVQVQKDAASLSPSTPGEGFLFVRAVNYDTTYKVEIDGVEKASYTTADAYGTNPKVSVEEVAQALHTQLTANLGAGWTVEVTSPVVRVVKDDGSDFGLSITDTHGNTMSRAVYGRVQRFTDLPVVGQHGYIVQVTGTDGEAGDDYFLRFEADAGTGLGAGIWKETVAPGIPTAFDASTMPHKLERQADGSFQLKQVDWGRRECGTEDTAKWPSFTGKTIRDVFYDRKRLCFLSDDDVIMSRSRELYSFFRETATTLLDSDPIDVTASGSKVSLLQYAVPFNKQLVIFSDQTQFVLDAEKLIASEPPGVKEITAYEIDPQAKPVAVGKTVFFPAKSGKFSRMMEYYLVPESETTDASDVTKHVPKYIPQDVFKMAASATNDVMLLLSREKRNHVYVYKYHWQSNQKLQSSWSHWEFRSDAVILNVDFIGDEAYFIVQYSDGVYLETLSVSEGEVDAGEEFTVRLDRRISEAEATAISYDSSTGLTSVSLPYMPSPDIKLVTRMNTGTGAADPYQEYVVTSQVGNVITVAGDLTGQKFFVGERYAFQYVFSRPVLKSPGPSGGQASVIAGRLQINRWLVSFAETGYFRAVVKTSNGTEYTYTYTGKNLGTANAVVGGLSVSDGEFGFRVNTESKKVRVTLINDSFLPSYFTGAEWEGRFERKTSRA